MPNDRRRVIIVALTVTEKASRHEPYFYEDNESLRDALSDAIINGQYTKPWFSDVEVILLQDQGDARDGTDQGDA